MAQVKLLKIGSEGISEEFNSSSDEITLASFTVQGGGPVLGSTGLDLNNQDIEDIKDVKFNDSSTAEFYVNSTQYVADDLMFESKENSIDVGAAVLFPVISDAADEVDALRIPALAGIPSATPSDGGSGYLVYDSTNSNLYAWTGSEWDNLSTVSSANNLDDDYTADEALSIRDAVYISAADSVSKAINSSAAGSRLLGFAVAAAADTDPVVVRKAGILGGFTGLTAGSRYYLDSTAGLITATLPAGAGAVVVQAGYAKSTTELDIQIQQIGKRAA